jgi:hypothetical protein
MNVFLLSISAALGFVLCAVIESKAEVADASYLCTAEQSAGLAYDKGTSRWRGAIFNAEDKFILTMKFIERVTKQTPPSYSLYTVTINRAGSNDIPCWDTLFEGSSAREVSITDDLAFNCATLTFGSVYRFDLKKGRYLDFYLEGGGISNGGTDTPSVTGGTCLKIK